METFLIIGLFLLCLYFAWRFLSLRRGIENLTSALRHEPVTSGKDLDPAAYQPRLRELCSVALDTVAEASLLLDSEQRQREFLEALLNEINDAIFIVDSNREIRFVNEAARRLFPSEQSHTERAFLDVCRDHRIYDTLVLAEEIESKVSEDVVLRTVDEKSGRIRETRLTVEAEPLHFAGNKEDSGTWILLRDVTNEVETEQIRRDFVANASHELRTPLSIINGYLETMDDSETDLNQAIFRRSIRTMRKHGERISRIVDDMLAISKLENAKDLLNLKPFDLRDSLDEMISQLMPLIEENHARIKIETGAEESWIINGDRYYWDQIFFNLIENALKQNKEPGLRVTIEFRRENGRIAISVADDGIGIPAQDLPLILKRFYRVQKHHSQNETAGTGLGLSIVKRAVEAHNGTVKVESEPGVKTVFTATIPGNTGPAETNAQAES